MKFFAASRRRHGETINSRISQSPGLYAISLGLSHTFPDDYEMLKYGLVMYDALYAWCQSCQTETHKWPPKMS
jgi:hypothetical protein